MGFGYEGKKKRIKKKQAQVNGDDLVDWFLAIDACLSS
jgi:hypothetical protein